MGTYTYAEILAYLAEKLQAALPSSLDEGGVSLEMDDLSVEVYSGKVGGGLIMQIVLGLLLPSVSRLHLQELMQSHFLGINTGGCTFCLDGEGHVLSLRAVTSATATPQENWEWLHRLLHVAFEWTKRLEGNEEFVSLLKIPPQTSQQNLSQKV